MHDLFTRVYELINDKYIEGNFITSLCRYYKMDFGAYSFSSIFKLNFSQYLSAGKFPKFDKILMNNISDI